MRKTISQTILILSLVMVISYNIYPTPLSPFEKAKNEVLEHQNSVNAKENLAKIYLENNDWETAETVVSEIRNPKSEIRNLIEFQKAEPGRIRQEINRWENIVLNYPNFRDGYLKLAILNWQVYNQDLAKWYWKKGFELDPNGVKTRQIGQLLELNQ